MIDTAALAAHAASDLLSFEMAQRMIVIAVVSVLGRWIWQTREDVRRVLTTLYGDVSDPSTGIVRRVHEIEKLHDDMGCRPPKEDRK